MDCCADTEKAARLVHRGTDMFRPAASDLSGMYGQGGRPATAENYWVAWKTSRGRVLRLQACAPSLDLAERRHARETSSALCRSVHLEDEDSQAHGSVRHGGGSENPGSGHAQSCRRGEGGRCDGEGYSAMGYRGPVRWGVDRIQGYAVAAVAVRLGRLALDSGHCLCIGDNGRVVPAELLGVTPWRAQRSNASTGAGAR